MLLCLTGLRDISRRLSGRGGGAARAVEGLGRLAGWLACQMAWRADSFEQDPEQHQKTRVGRGGQARASKSQGGGELSVGAWPWWDDFREARWGPMSSQTSRPLLGVRGA